MRPRLILTPTSRPPRSLLRAVRTLPSFACPLFLVPITLLHSCLSQLLTITTPYVLRFRLGIDPVGSPTIFSVLSFLSATAELFIRLPLETILRRGQMASSSGTKDSQGSQSSKAEAVVDVGPYRGVVGTAWSIMREEGEAANVMSTTLQRSGSHKMPKKGQGIQGLWRGWRVGMWGLAGMWGASALGGGGKGGEF